MTDVQILPRWRVYEWSAQSKLGPDARIGGGHDLHRGRVVAGECLLGCSPPFVLEQVTSTDQWTGLLYLVK